MSVGGISSRSLHGRVARALGERILNGELTPGSVLPPEAELSKRLGISRSALREAFKLLVAKGLVEAKPKTGTRICRRSSWNLLDPDMLDWQAVQNPANSGFQDRLQELRLIVEPAAAKLAARRRRPSDLQNMQRALTAIAAATTDDERRAGFAEFRRSILAATQNDLVGALQILASIGSPLDDARRTALLPLCRAMLDCLIEQDEPIAEAIMIDLILFWNPATDSAK